MTAGTEHSEGGRKSPHHRKLQTKRKNVETGTQGKEYTCSLTEWFNIETVWCRMVKELVGAMR
jgi:hypothetical protein